MALWIEVADEIARRFEIFRRENEAAAARIERDFWGTTEHLLGRASKDPDLLSGLEGGGVIAEFENRFAQLAGGAYALSCSSGTAAMHIALMAGDIGPGDEVIVSPYGWGQTVAAILAVGATPVFADIDPLTYNLNPDSVAERLGPRTRALLPTHLFGYPADMERLQMLAEKYRLLLLADAAQALGATIQDKPVAVFADITAFSIGRRKILTTGEGGMLVTSDPLLYERAVAVSQHPLRALREVEDSEVRAGIMEMGLSFRMHPVAAAIGLDGMDQFLSRLAARREWGRKLVDLTSGLPGLRPPIQRPGVEPTFHSFCPSFLPEELDAADRGEFVISLQERGVPLDIGPVRMPIHKRLHGLHVNLNIWYSRALRCTPPHATWLPGSQPNAERRCAQEELRVSDTECKS